MWPSSSTRRRAAAERTDGEADVVASRRRPATRPTRDAEVARDRRQRSRRTRSTAALSSLGDSIRTSASSVASSQACSASAGVQQRERIGHGYNRVPMRAVEAVVVLVLGGTARRRATPRPSSQPRPPAPRVTAPPPAQPGRARAAEAPPTEVALGVRDPSRRAVPRIVQRRPGPALLPVRLDAPASPTSSPTTAAC